ncbi:heterodisulfide reductase-related iron-sulfur binding cluster, partial [Escherichia coli]
MIGKRQQLQSAHVFQQRERLFLHPQFADQDTCCGFGGTFSVKMAEISGEMVKEKVLHLMDAKPEYLIGADVS